MSTGVVYINSTCLIEDTPGSIVGIAGYYAENDKRQHVIVGTKDGNVHDFSFISHL